MVEYEYQTKEMMYHHGSIGTGKITPVCEGTIFDLGNRLVKILHIPGQMAGTIACPSLMFISDGKQVSSGGEKKSWIGWQH